MRTPTARGVSGEDGDRGPDRAAGRGTAFGGERAAPGAHRRGTERAEARVTRGLGEPALFAIMLSAIVSAIFFSLGVVADDALGLTPVVFLLAGGFFVLTMATYVEGNSLHPERGGASTFARYAFDEFWSFVAGWAILLDYVIVMALASVAIADYLSAFWGELQGGVEEVLISAVAVVLRRRGERARAVGPPPPHGPAALAGRHRGPGGRHRWRCTPSSSTWGRVFDTVKLGAPADLAGRGVRHRAGHAGR